MSIAFGLPDLIVTDRFIGNDDLALKLPSPKSIKMDNVVVAYTGSLAVPHLLKQIHLDFEFEDAESAGEVIVDNLKLDQDYSLLVADGTSLWELDSQRSLYQIEFSAIGAGYQYALGAYFTTLDPLKAIRAACHFSPLCSLPLDIWTWDQEWGFKTLQF